MLKFNKDHFGKLESILCKCAICKISGEFALQERPENIKDVPAKEILNSNVFCSHLEKEFASLLDISLETSK